MKLHEDKDSFGVLLNSISEKTGIRFDILENDSRKNNINRNACFEKARRKGAKRQ